MKGSDSVSYSARFKSKSCYNPNYLKWFAHMHVFFCLDKFLNHDRLQSYFCVPMSELMRAVQNLK